MKADEKDEFAFPEPPGPPSSPGKRRSGVGGPAGGDPKTPSRAGGRGGKNGRKGGPDTVDRATLEANAARWTGGPTILEDSLFRTYRSGGGLDTDTDTGQGRELASNVLPPNIIYIIISLVYILTWGNLGDSLLHTR